MVVRAMAAARTFRRRVEAQVSPMDGGWVSNEDEQAPPD